MRQQHALYQDDESALLPAKWAVHFSRDDERQDTAIECIETASDFSVDPKLRSAFDRLAAECWLNLGQTNKAMSCLLEAYRGNEAEPAPLIRLGRLWSLKPDAAAILGKRASLPSATHVDKMVLAAMRQALDDKDEAVRLLQEVYAMRLRQGYFPEPGFYLWMASLLESQRALPETEKWLTKALIVHPYSHELQNFLAYMWAEQGTNLGKAAEMINAALTAQPNNAAYLDTKGWVLYKEGRCYEALQYLLKAAEKDNQEPVILDHVGDTLLAVGRKSEAVSFWTQSHKFDPQPTVAEKLRRHGAPVPETTP